MGEPQNLQIAGGKQKRGGNQKFLKYGEGKKEGEMEKNLDF